MASAGFGAAFRHLRDLFGGGTVVGLDDGQLLARYESAGTRRPSRPWWPATGRWSWPPAGPSSGTSTTSRTPSRPPSSSWPGRPARSGAATPWAAGCTASPTASAVQASVEARRRRRKEAEASAMAPRIASRPDLTTTSSALILHEEIDRLPEAPAAAGRALRPGGADLRAGRPPAPMDRADAPVPAGQGPAAAQGPADPPGRDGPGDRRRRWRPGPRRPSRRALVRRRCSRRPAGGLGRRGAPDPHLI